MKKEGILNKDISELVASMGHGQRVLIVDAGFPIPIESGRIDLALVCGIPTFLDTLKAALKDLQVESVIIAHEMSEKNPKLYNQLQDVIGDIPIVSISHNELKEQSCNSSGIIRTGECSPFANIVLISGVTF
ncbi:MAG: D-ribose pyranase [Spirochaetia bacterium]|jgi:D-ribose pyranase|nr:D-ribose pyranase [Spirochaetia bacterium]